MREFSCHSEAKPKNIIISFADAQDDKIEFQDDRKNGFTLAEVLVVMALVAIIGTIMVVIFANTLRGSNKAQILSAIKQNGQAVLDNMDKTIRNADNVVCNINEAGSRPTLVVVKNGIYTRYQVVLPTTSTNGYIFQDFPVQPADKDIKLFTNTVCSDPPAADRQILTDTNTKTGVSVTGAVFQPSSQSGSKFQQSVQSGSNFFVSISFVVGPGKDAPQIIAGQIDPVTFKTTIQLR